MSHIWVIYESHDQLSYDIYKTFESEDFEGGRFIFDPSPEYGINRDQHIEPVGGRVSAFTSGAENPHRVERVKSGERLAFTMGFTCDPKNAIPDPKLPPL